MRGYQAKVNDGVFAQGTAPYGYRLVGLKREARLEIDTKHKKIIALIFEWYVCEGIGTVAIAQRLTDMGIPTPGEAINRNRGRENGIWYQSSVYDIITDETYAGVWYGFKYKRIGKGKCVKRPREEWKPVQVPAIISRDVWERAQQRLAHKGDHCRNVKHDYLMRTRVTCMCGYAMQGRARRSRRVDGDDTLYYRCSSQIGKLVKGRCTSPHFRADDVDAEVWAQTKELLTNPGDVLRAYQKAQRRQNAEQTAIGEQISIIDEQIAGHNATIDNLLDARKSVTSDTLKRKLDADADRIAGLIDDLTKRQTTLEQKLHDTTITDQHIASVTEKLKDAHSLVAEAEGNPDAQRKLIEFLNLRAVLRVDEAKDRWVDIQFLLDV
jgi:site-specific DNA recombinase